MYVWKKKTFNMNLPSSFEMSCSSEGVHLINNESLFWYPNHALTLRSHTILQFRIGYSSPLCPFASIPIGMNMFWTSKTFKKNYCFVNKFVFFLFFNKWAYVYAKNENGKMFLHLAYKNQSWWSHFNPIHHTPPYYFSQLICLISHIINFTNWCDFLKLCK